MCTIASVSEGVKCGEVASRIQLEHCTPPVTPAGVAGAAVISCAVQVARAIQDQTSVGNGTIRPGEAVQYGELVGGDVELVDCSWV